MALPALIVGGGIAGLSSAVALGLKGIPCVVFERNRFEDTTGTGIQLSPNATRLLFQTGLKNPLLETAQISIEIAIRHWRTGRISSSVPLGRLVERHCDSPYLQILRSKLVQMLLYQARQCDHIELRQGMNIEMYEQTATEASVVSCGSRHNGLVVIGADGVRSTIRRVMGRLSDPPFSEWHAWRTTIRTESTNKAATRTTIWCGPHAHVVTYPVDSQGTVNCVFITKSRRILDESWRDQGSLTDLQDSLQDWNNEIFELLDQIDESRLFRWGLYRHDKIRTGWSDGRCTLIGDACHSVLPFLAQGAALAIEDAFTLADCVHKHLDNVPQALRNFEKARYSRTKSIQRRSARLGYVYHLQPPLSWLRDVSAKWAIHEIVRNIYAFDDICVCS